MENDVLSAFRLANLIPARTLFQSLCLHVHHTTGTQARTNILFNVRLVISVLCSVVNQLQLVIS